MSDKNELDTFSDILDSVTHGAGLGTDNDDILNEIKNEKEAEADVSDDNVSNDEIVAEKEVVENEEQLKELSSEEVVEDKKEVAPENIENIEEKKEEEVVVSDEPKAEESENAYVPNFKYSVKNEEKEIPEFLRGSVTNAESEAQVRDIMTKIDGFDGIKESRDKALDGFKEASGINKQHEVYYENLNTLINTKDWDNFYKSAGIKEDDILDFAEEILRRKELSPQQQQDINKNADTRMQNYNNTQQKIEVENSNLELQQRLDQLEIQNTFTNPDISEAEKLFDERCNAPGSFRKVVGEIGNAAWDTKNRLNVMEACQEAIKRYGITAKAPTVEAPKNVSKEHKVAEGVEQRVVTRNVEHIPSVRNSGSKTPIKRLTKDVDDMQRIADEYLSKL